MKNKFCKSGNHETLACLATGALVVFYIWLMFALDKKSQKNGEIVQQKLTAIQQELQNKDLDIYTKVKLHEAENTLIYYDHKSPEYRKVKRQILREYRQNKKVEKTR